MTDIQTKIFNEYFTKNIKETGDIVESIKKTIYEASLIEGVLEILCQSDKIILRIDTDGRNRKTTI